MKLKLLLLIAAFSTFCSAQIVNIPDQNFKGCLLIASPMDFLARDLSGNPMTIDANGDGQIQVSEALQVGQLYFDELDIHSMEGIQAFTNLRVLKCKENQLTELNLEGLVNLEILDCSENSISSLNISSLSSLRELNCFDNDLTLLDASNMNALSKLICSGNQLTALNLTGTNNIIVLECNSNNLSELDIAHLENIKTLNCSSNLLTDLDIENLTDLEALRCSHNLLTELDVVNLTDLDILECSNNQISELAIAGLIELRRLNIGANLISEVDLSNLADLEELFLSENQLTELTVSGHQNLNHLSCGSNPFTELIIADLPVLDWLYCPNNQLQALDLSQLDNYMQVYLSNSPIQTLNVKNGKSENLTFANCPNLQYICADQSQVNSIQSKINQYGYTNCFVNSYCTFEPGGTFYSVSGTIKWDQDSNGCDAGDTISNHSQIVIDNGISPVSWFAMNGNYSSMLQEGTYTISPVVSNYFTATPSSVSVTFPNDLSPFVQDFCIASDGIHHDVEITILPVGSAIPGFDSSYIILYKNNGTEIESGSIQLEFQGEVIDVVSSGTAFASQDENSVSWNFTGLNPFESKTITVSFNLNSPMETPALNMGDMLTFVSSVEIENEETPVDNEMTLRQEVINSMDPNDIRCLEGTNVSESQIGEYVHYMIRFENNGTANAQNVIVNDVLRWEKFEISSVVPVHASHPFEMTFNHLNHKMEIFFYNIDLPFDDANNDGFFVFKAKLKADLVSGDTFSNSAKIFFDFNFPIETNEYVTTIGSLGIGEQQQQLSFYPNPFTDVINLDAMLSGGTMTIYDLSGRLLKSLSIEGNQVNLKDLKSGNYIARIESGDKITTLKLVKK